MGQPIELGHRRAGARSRRRPAGLPQLRLVRTLGAIALLATLLVPAPPAAANVADPWIVLLEDDADVVSVASRAEREDGIRPTHRFQHALKGFAAPLTLGQLRRLERQPGIRAIVPDSRVELVAQSTPAAISRVGATLSPAARIDGRDGADERVDVDVAIIDTGIQPDHPDLNVVGGYNCTTSNTGAWGDANGHGTHVAGTVGALDNGYGVVGVAPGARLWAVRVFDAYAYSRISWIVCGIDWVTRQRDPDDPSRPRIEVANMSLRDAGTDDGNCGLTNDDPEHRAICASVAAGTTYVVAAGNDRTSTTGWRPASYNEVITVSAIADFDGRPGGLRSGAPCRSHGTYDVDDTFADFSNYGPDVDITAPGVCVRSTYKGGTYATISGTSMAAPAVAGGAALYKAVHPDASPAEVRAALLAAGSYDWDTATDRDSVHEPLLDVSTFGSPPGVGFRTAASTRVWAGAGSSVLDVSIVRRNGLSGDVTVSLAALPAGVYATTATLGGWSTGPTRVEIAAGESAASGLYDVQLVARAAAGEWRRALRLEVARQGEVTENGGRLAGPDRFATAAAVSAATFAPGPKVAYVAYAFNYPDALAAAAAAGTVPGPVLLAARSGPLNPATVAELKRLKPERIVVLGSSGVISESVKNALRAYATSGTVTRLAGPDRFATAAAVSAATFAPGPKVAYVAYAFNYPDALAAAAAAGTVPGPVLLAARSGPLNPATVAELKRLKPERIVVLGSSGVISESVKNALRAYATSGTVTRLAGPDRFATAAAVSAATFAPGPKVAYVAYAFNYPDALAAAAAAGTVPGPVLLAARSGPLNPATVAELKRLKPERIVVLGSSGVISESVKNALRAYDQRP